jgi:hypothetical protein
MKLEGTSVVKLGDKSIGVIMLMDGHVYVPIRDVAELIRLTVGWD